MSSKFSCMYALRRHAPPEDVRSKQPRQQNDDVVAHGFIRVFFTACDVRQRTLFDLLGPIIDPIGYQIELETYVAKIMRGPANLYISLAGYLSSASVFFHFFVDPHQALTVRCDLQLAGKGPCVCRWMLPLSSGTV